MLAPTKGLEGLKIGDDITNDRLLLKQLKIGNFRKVDDMSHYFPLKVPVVDENGQKDGK